MIQTVRTRTVQRCVVPLQPHHTGSHSNLSSAAPTTGVGSEHRLGSTVNQKRGVFRIVLLLLLLYFHFASSSQCTIPGQQRDNNGTTRTTSRPQRDNISGTTQTTAGHQRDNSGTTSGHPEREPHKHTRTSFFPQLLSLHDLADNNFNLCSTLSASGQPLTPVSMPAPQDAADDHAARGGFAPRRASSAGYWNQGSKFTLVQPSRISRPVTACSTGQARLNTKRASLG